MPRHLRAQLDGFPLHVRQRGINREVTFLDSSDYELFLGLLAELTPKSGCDVHAYVLMPNHVHLLLSPAQVARASWLMKNLCQRYAQVFNRRHKRTGSMWEGRFRSSAVDTDAYLLTCQRYIELNPVRAGIVDTPSQYPWSSFATNALGQASLFLQPHDCYVRLGDPKVRPQVAYAGLFEQDLSPAALQEIRTAIDTNSALGSAEFRRGLQEETGRIATPRPRGRPRIGTVPPDGKRKLTPV